MRILVVDEPRMAAAIRRVLIAERHSVDVAEDGVGALALAGDRDYDVIVLDRMLPDLDGLEVLRLLRSRGVSTPVLMLTALGTLDHRVSGLDAGADDYLAKPFAFAELLARLRAPCAGAAPRCGASWSGDIQLDPVQPSVMVATRSRLLGARIALLALSPPPGGTGGHAADSPATPSAVRPSPTSTPTSSTSTCTTCAASWSASAAGTHCARSVGWAMRCPRMSRARPATSADERAAGATCGHRPSGPDG